MNNKDLLKQYVTTGRTIPEYQLARLNNNFRTSYYYSRIIALSQSSEIQNYEFKYLPNGKIKDKFELAVVRQNGVAIYYIKNPSEQVQLAAINKDSEYIRFISNPSENVQIAAIENNPLNIHYIKNPSEAVQLALVKQDGGYIGDIYQIGINPSERVQLTAVENSPNSIEEIPNPSEQVQLVAVNKRRGYAIKFIENPTEQVQLAAINQNAKTIDYIKNPTPKAIELAKKLGYE